MRIALDDLGTGYSSAEGVETAGQRTAKAGPRLPEHVTLPPVTHLGSPHAVLT